MKPSKATPEATPRSADRKRGLERPIWSPGHPIGGGRSFRHKLDSKPTSTSPRKIVMKKPASIGTINGT